MQHKLLCFALPCIRFAHFLTAMAIARQYQLTLFYFTVTHIISNTNRISIFLKAKKSLCSMFSTVWNTITFTIRWHHINRQVYTIMTIILFFYFCSAHKMHQHTNISSGWTRLTYWNNNVHATWTTRKYIGNLGDSCWSRMNRFLDWLVSLIGVWRHVNTKVGQTKVSQILPTTGQPTWRLRLANETNVWFFIGYTITILQL